MLKTGARFIGALYAMRRFFRSALVGTFLLGEGRRFLLGFWIPACAGMTDGGGRGALYLK